MKARGILVHALTCTSVFVFAAGCSDNVAPKPEPHGTIKVVTTTSGGDPDDDGYTVVIDGTRNLTVGIDRIAFFDGMSAGSHVVTLEGIAGNCDQVQPHSVTVAADDTSTISFDVRCDATGVEITTQTVGPDYAPYQVSVGNRFGSVAPNGAITLTRLTPGSHTVLVTLPTFCQIVGDLLPVVMVTNRKIAQTTLRVQCKASDRVLAFVLDNNGDRSIVLSRLDGNGRITIGTGHEPAWSPDGTRILYTTAGCFSAGYYSDDVQCSGGLQLLNPESGVSTPLAYGDNGFDPAWSPDGKTVVFAKLNDARNQSKLIVRKPDGTLFPIELDEHIGHPAHPAWSPDGRRIAFECVMETSVGIGQYQICAVNPDGTGFTRLTNEKATDLRPAWSPDGRRIAFSTTVFTKPGDINPTSIAVMSSDGSDITRIAAGDSPAWSPDGSRLLFNTLDGLFISNADGTSLIRITSGRHRYAAWRPDVNGGAGDWDY